ncbi:MAG: nitrophenyl compound nitroreductase subunit ArsF family protein [Planctomycetia bacterium]|jgi:hypothetical protein
MEFKNAVAVCLISFFSASLVVLIARSLDLHAASEIRPELEQIRGELHALRAQLAGKEVGDLGPVSDAAEVTDGVVVYFAHSSERCPDCRELERQAHEAIQSGFAEELKDGKVVWQVRDYEKPNGAFLEKDYGVYTSTVVLVRMKDGKAVDGKHLDESLGKVKQGLDKELIDYIQGEVRAMLDREEPTEELSPENTPDATDEVPVPTP